MDMADGNNSNPPKSINSQTACLISLFALLSALFYINVKQNQLDISQQLILFIVIFIGIQIIYDIFVRKIYLKESTGLIFTKSQLKNNINYGRSIVKIFGFLLSLAMVGLAYYCFPIYETNKVFIPFWEVLNTILNPFESPYLVSILSCCLITYFVLIDAIMKSPKDGYWQLAIFSLFIWDEVDWEKLKQHLMEWVLKGFFLPIMIPLFIQGVSRLQGSLLQIPDGNYVGYIQLLTVTVLCISYAIQISGYVFTLRTLDTHIRNCNPYFFAWVVTLIMFIPFWPVMTRSYLKIDDGYHWWKWFSDYSVLLYAWGALIILCQLIWIWSDALFGLRYSQLTNRGIITNGPYRYFKHPSYLFQNIALWLVSVPFLSHGGVLLVVKHCTALLVINTLYYVRARAEEKHLSQDPTYQAYANWINKHGLLSRLGNFFPSLQFRST